jgi:hypothetical protein
MVSIFANLRRLEKMTISIRAVTKTIVICANERRHEKMAKVIGANVRRHEKVAMSLSMRHKT